MATEKQKILDNLQRSWLQQSELLLQNYFGLSASNVDLKIILDDDIPSASAYVSGSGTTTLINLKLHIDVNEMLSIDPSLSWPNQTSDQLIAHEMTHAIMGVTTNFVSFDKWFVEGAAELIPGGDARLNAVRNNLVGEGAVTDQQIVDNIDNLTGQNFGGSHRDYATAYTAARYLHSIIGGNGIKDMMAYLAGNTTRTTDNYFAQAGIAGISSTADFIADFKTNGAAFIGSMNLANNDTGGIGGADADGGGRDTTTSGTMPDVDNPNTNPLAGFNEIYPDLTTQTVTNTTTTTQIALPSLKSIYFQVGDNANETLELGLRALEVSALGLSSINLESDAQNAISLFDLAIDAISSERARLGALQNRPDLTISNLSTTVENVAASRSRIVDADYASETASLTRAVILQQAAVSMITQATNQPALVLSLLT
ncbi:MAG: flagellinolysin [Gammaproteobacteria bacterium]